MLLGKSKAFLLAIEYDYGEITLPEGVKQHILNQEIHKGNAGKSVFYTQDITDFKEYTPDEITQLLNNIMMKPNIHQNIINDSLYF